MKTDTKNYNSPEVEVCERWEISDICTGLSSAQYTHDDFECEDFTWN